MIHWRDFIIPKYPRYCYKGKWYTSGIFSFDTETTTLFCINGEWVAQNFNEDSDTYSAAPKLAYVYIWQFNANGTVVYGREISEFFEFWDAFAKINSYTTIVYVHNLGFDFDFLCEHFPEDTKVFAKSAYRPMYVKSESMRLEMRCSYMLTNMSLAAVAKEFALDVEKLSGDLVYNKARTPQTPLTEQEMAYCENDVKIINALIDSVFIPLYGNCANIPLTQTGQVRRVAKEVLKKDSGYMRDMQRQKPDFEQYKIMTALLQGGYTHLNFIYNGTVLHGVKSYDKSSSYPDTMCTRKFPCGAFRVCDKYVTNDDKYAYILYVRMENIRAKGVWSYIARHKVRKARSVVNDNGKILSAEFIEMWVTDVDFEIIKNNYAADKIDIQKIYAARKSYLPKKLIDLVLERYSGKTTLKGDKNNLLLYLRLKQQLNAFFGMCITNNIRDEAVFNAVSHQWENVELTDSDIADKLKKDRPFLAFSWGIWITAYARADLWELISQIGVDCIYCDTDSVKIINAEKYADIIDSYNKKCAERIDKVCADLELDKQLFYPQDKKGVVHALGFFEYECEYNDFLSLGSKKYCYNIGGEFGFTVAGLRKKYIDENGEHITLKSMRDFRLKNKVANGRVIHWHLSDMKPTEIKDYLGNKYVTNNTQGMAIMNACYTFSLSGEYEDFLLDNRDKYRTPFRINY